MEIVLKKGIDWHFPSIGYDSQDGFESAARWWMGADILKLFVDPRLGNLALLDVNDHAIVVTQKPEVQPRFSTVPLAADHDAITVSVRRRTRHHWGDEIARNFADAFEQIGNLFVLQLQLKR